ncbi:MAG: translation elongation factor Ts [Defluviitaleaceae bacterium]|nr:translation elongation factor Ts [Defluviitaleaceae bacterium]
MAATPALIKELRELTGSGMTDCKKALEETGGDIQKAIEFLREKGLAAAAKKSGRIAAEGVVAIKVSDDKKKAVMVEVNCETDFVAINPDFKAYVDEVAEQAFNSEAEDAAALLTEAWAKGGGTVEEVLKGKIATIGENLNIRRIARIQCGENGMISSYIHGGGKIGAMLKVHSEKAGDPALAEMGYNLCMQIAALLPKYLKSEDVDQEYIANETRILEAAAKNDESLAGKPEKVLEGIVKGRLQKQLKEICLTEQEYVKDGSMTVSQYVESVAKEIGSPISLVRFECFEKGAGIEKKQEDFAEEVAKAMQG